ncbi:MAG: lipid A export permease/ATP-binding protein MsbA [Gammaproteobacteria bacterium]|nr:lipid A export permease/ATP-binding protein MsbA [Gammaproteobacteria bacterium]
MYLLGVLGMLMYSASQFVVLWCVNEFLKGDDPLVRQHPEKLLFQLPLGVIGLFLLRGLGDYMANYFPGWVGRQVVRALRDELFAHYMRLPAGYFERESPAAMLARITTNIELVAQATTQSLTVLIRDSITVSALIVYIFWRNWQLAATAMVVAPLIAGLIRSVNLRFRRYGTRIQNSVGDVTRVAKEALDGQRVVKIFNAQEHMSAAFAAVNEQNRRNNMRLISASASSNPIVQLIAAFGLAGVMVVAGRLVLHGQMVIADVLLFLIALLLIPDPLKRLLAVAGPLQQGIAAGASMFAELDTPAEPAGGTRPLLRARGDVEFRGVGFAYNQGQGQVLHDVNFSVAAGQTLAIVGRSGSGKSTLMALLPRFHDPSSGAILLDGVDIREYGLHDLRAQLSLVTQEVVLFNDTIAANIRFGAGGVDAAAIESAARAAHVLEFAAELPQGLDTMVGDRGMLLSGGQRQRIAIARALLRNTPILILDEATSALDTASERHIQAALEQLLRNRTTFVIAHRLSTIENADRIIVMHEGALVESGTHAELIARGGRYAQLHRLQFAE